MRSIIMIGTFPPPVHGMAMVNAAVRDRLQMKNDNVRILDVAAHGRARGMYQRLSRLPRVCNALARLLLARKGTHLTLYMSVSGGWGQIYECAFAMVARLRRIQLVLHHHSFAYLGHRSVLTAWLVRAAGKHAAHITLSSGMKQRLRACYDVSGEVFAVSNAALLFRDDVRDKRSHAAERTLVIGFLSNLSREKGVFEFLDLVDAASHAGIHLKAKLAGPFQDAVTEQKVRSRLEHLPMVEYVDAVYDTDKTAFYQSLDAFIFPTRYANEAEPLVVLEAMQHALPVIAYGRGSIPELLTTMCGLVVPPADDFIAPAVNLLQHWAYTPEVLTRAGTEASRQFDHVRAHGQRAWAEVEAILWGTRRSEQQCNNKVDTGRNGGS